VTVYFIGAARVREQRSYFVYTLQKTLYITSSVFLMTVIIVLVRRRRRCAQSYCTHVTYFPQSIENPVASPYPWPGLEIPST
jgi:hypothetical protein